MDSSRRDFLKTTTAAGVGFLAGAHRPGPLLAFNGAPSEKVVLAIVGVNGRGVDHAHNFGRMANVEVAYICDVDARVVDRAVKAATRAEAPPPKVVGDFRRVLDDRSVDAITIAAPDHWHAPMALLALQAGKHVYVEKPSGHDPHEDELLIAAAKAHKPLVQLGTQRRSGPHFHEARNALTEGAIGTPYLARAWYVNTRAGIGKGKPAPVPPSLDWALWQGPAPRTAYRDNVVHYNWHWFTRWGTGEICNNGTHELDVARWMLGVDYPTSVVSSGTRTHFDDDWEFPDTQDATFEFAGKKTIVWHGQSCNGLPMYGRARGIAVLGTGGALVIDQDGFVITDVKNKVVRERSPEKNGDAAVAGDGALSRMHMQNFVDAIRTGAPLNAPIADGAKTGMLCHLGTIAQQTGRKLRIDSSNGRILDDADAMKRWSREYAPGWAPRV